MTPEEKLLKITNWFSKETEEDTRQLAKQENFGRVKEIELLIGESFPVEILNLYRQFDGDTGSGYGSFLGHSLVGLVEMISSLEFSKTLVKPANPKILNPKDSDEIIENLIKTVVQEISLNAEISSIPQKWYKAEFECSPGSIGGPYFYSNSDTSDKEREVIRLSDAARKDIYKVAKQLHQLELKDYNWDNLKITAYGDGRMEVNRTYHDFNSRLSSIPDRAIRKKYYHIKWLPLISDHGGNYIGIDLDPDDRGIKGQVIVFGRDEEKMYVVANSWEEFLDFNLQIINNGGAEFKTQSHLHDIYRRLKA